MNDQLDPRRGCITSVAAVKGGEVRCVTAQRFALLRSQLILFEPLQQNAALDGSTNKPMRINSKWLFRHAAPLLLPIATIGLIVRDYLLDHGPTGLPDDLPNWHNKPGELKVFLIMVVIETVIAYWILYPREEALWWRALACAGLFLFWSVVNVIPIVHAGGIMVLHLWWLLLLTLGCFVTFAVSGIRSRRRHRAHRSARTA